MEHVGKYTNRKTKIMVFTENLFNKNVTFQPSFFGGYVKLQGSTTLKLNIPKTPKPFQNRILYKYSPGSLGPLNGMK